MKTLIFVNISVALIIMFLLTSEASAWWDSGWSKGRQVTVDNSSNSSALTNHEVKVDVTYDSDMLSDFTDMRSVDSDDSTALDHWRESYAASSSAVFWVKVPSIPASPSKTIYIYYWNGSVASASSYVNTFPWITETVDSTADDVGTYTSIALKANNYPCIAYKDATSTAAKYAYWGGGSWTIETVYDVASTDPAYTSLAIGSDDVPQICFVKDWGTSSSKLIYGVRSGSWSTSEITSSSYTGPYCSICLDYNNKPHMSLFKGGSYDDLWYAEKTTGSWNYTEVHNSTNPGIGKWCDTAIDPSDYPHISYYSEEENNSATQDLCYAEKTTGSWVTKSVDNTGNVGKYTSIIMDSYGFPQIAYYMVICTSPHESLKGKGTIRVRVRRSKSEVKLRRGARKRLAKLASKEGGTLYSRVYGSLRGRRGMRLLSHVNKSELLFM